MYVVMMAVNLVLPLEHFKGFCPKPKVRRRIDMKKGKYMCVLDNFENYEINKTTFK